LFGHCAIWLLVCDGMCPSVGSKRLLGLAPRAQIRRGMGARRAAKLKATACRPASSDSGSEAVAEAGAGKKRKSSIEDRLVLPPAKRNKKGEASCSRCGAKSSEVEFHKVLDTLQQVVVPLG